MVGAAGRRRNAGAAFLLFDVAPLRLIVEPCPRVPALGLRRPPRAAPAHTVARVSVALPSRPGARPATSPRAAPAHTVARVSVALPSRPGARPATSARAAPAHTVARVSVALPSRPGARPAVPPPRRSRSHGRPRFGCLALASRRSACGAPSTPLPLTRSPAFRLPCPRAPALGLRRPPRAAPAHTVARVSVALPPRPGARPATSPPRRSRSRGRPRFDSSPSLVLAVASLRLVGRFGLLA